MENRVLAVVSEIYRDTGCNVKTVAVAQRLYVDPSTARRWLTQMEKANLIERVGKRCGWLLKQDVRCA